MTSAIHERFQTQRKALAEAFLSDHDVSHYLLAHTQIADHLIQSLAREACLPKDIALLALGGYGRRELFPFSDIDLMVLVPDVLDNEVKVILEEFVNSLWNCGLTIGQSVRSISEAIEESLSDITVQTAILEARLIDGNVALFHQLQHTFRSNLDSATFFRAKAFEMAQRHQKFENTPYSLEPNVKESPGGLRDLQVIFWCSHAANLGNTPEEMYRLGTITEVECEQLKEVDLSLKRTRILLHLLSHRHEDRLIFDLQNAMAEASGYKTSELQLASEALMKRYYITAKTVTQFSEIFMQMLQEQLFPEDTVSEVIIDKTFLAHGNTLDITHSDAFKDDPNAILRCFYLLESSQILKRLSSGLLRALLRARFCIDDHFRNDPQNKQMFMQIIKMEHGVSHALMDLNQWGILGRFIPEFNHLVGQMQHDLFHVYTVDQHTMRVVRNLRYFTRSEYAHEYPICTGIMRSMQDNWKIVLAALFHDIGKGLGGSHEEKGAIIVQNFCERFAIDPDTTEFLTFLVREHLTMSLVAQKQDLSNPEVIEKFAQKVGNLNRLNALFLLTVCDIRATSPKVWSQWKSQLLQDLYWQTLPLLRNNIAPSPDDFLMVRQKEAKSLILSSGVSEKQLHRIWKKLTLQYFLRHTADGIAWQTIELAKVYPCEEPLVKARLLPQGAGLEIMVYIEDQPLLFARILAFLQKNRFSVLDARIYTTRDQYALDTFIVSDNGGRDLATLIEDINHNLAQWLIEQKPLPESRPVRLSRRSKHFPVEPMIKIEPDDTGNNYLLSVICTDRLGLLYDIAKLLNYYRINLQTAKIMTMGERVEDVFLIDGPILADIDKTVKFENDLMKILHPKFL